VSKDSAEKYCKYTANKAYIRADYNVEILIKKWQALTNFLASRKQENLGMVIGKNNRVLLTIGMILRNIAGDTGWLD